MKTEKQKEEEQKVERKYFEVGERSINEIVADLSKTIPQSMLKTKQLSGNKINYISWSDATRLLDAYAPGWSFDVVSIQHIKEQVVLTVELKIPTKDGMICRQATGNESDVTSSYGDCFSNAESMALRRAAAKFGLARYLYSK